jgi:hypothetical protein
MQLELGAESPSGAHGQPSPQRHCPTESDDPCDQKLSPRDIARLKRAQIEIERLKWELGARPPSRFDLYKCRNGDIVVKRKGDSSGPGEHTGLNIHQF